MARVNRFDFKQLDVYQAAVDHFAWAIFVTSDIPWYHRRVTDQVVGTALSMLGNLGEARGRALMPMEMKQHYRYALGSTHEAAAYLDALFAMGRIDDDAYNEQEELLARIGSMLTSMMNRQDRLARNS